MGGKNYAEQTIDEDTSQQRKQCIMFGKYCSMKIQYEILILRYYSLYLNFRNDFFPDFVELILLKTIFRVIHFVGDLNAYGP